MCLIIGLITFFIISFLGTNIISCIYLSVKLRMNFITKGHKVIIHSGISLIAMLLWIVACTVFTGFARYWYILLPSTVLGIMLSVFLVRKERTRILIEFIYKYL